MKSKKKHFFTQGLKIFLAVGLIYWLWSSGKIDFSILKNFLAPQWALLGLGLLAINVFLCSERWRLLLKIQDRPTSVGKAYKLSLVGAFFNYAMPGGVGGDVVKAYYFHKDTPNSKVIALTSIVVDRILGLYTMMLMASFIMAYDWQRVSQVPMLKTLFWSVLSLSVVTTFGLLIVFSRRLNRSGRIDRLIKVLPWSQKIRKLYDSLNAYGKSYSVLGKIILLSVAAQFFSIGYLILAGELSGAEAPWIAYFVVAPLGYIATGLPITPAGVGVGQAAFYYLFNLYLGEQTNLGSNTITAMQVGLFIVSLAGAFFYLRRGQPMTSNFEDVTEDPTRSEYAPSR